MKGPQRLAPRELEELLGQLRAATRPADRLRLASRIWELISSFSADEQKTVLLELGIRNADRLQEMLSRGRGSRVSVLLEFLDRQFRDLAIQRSVPPPVSPRRPVIEMREAGEAAAGIKEPVEEESGREGSPSEEVQQHSRGDDGEGPLEDERESSEENHQPLPARTEKDPGAQPDLPANETAGFALPEEEDKQESPANEIARDSAAHGKELEEISRRLSRLRANWMKRRFLIDRIRLGNGDEDPDSLIRLIGGAGLSPQNYYWVVTEMAARGILSPSAMALGIDLAPDELAARQLQRRFDRRPG